jgi:hypothetical protein
MRAMATVLVVTTLGLVGAAEAKGCLKGAAVGAVAGHVAGHHAVVGAAAGCVIEHHREKVRDHAAAHPAPAVPASPPAAATGQTAV